MRVLFTERFKKRFAKLPRKIQQQFGKRFDLFLDNPNHALLRPHPLRGNLVGFRAFSVTGDYRVIYCILDQETVKLIDIGTHSQIYE